MAGWDWDPDTYLAADADLRLARLEDPLPQGPFDLVISALAVHHLEGDAKRDLFTRVAQLTETFVLGDVVRCRKR